MLHPYRPSSDETVAALWSPGAPVNGQLALTTAGQTDEPASEERRTQSQQTKSRSRKKKRRCRKKRCENSPSRHLSDKKTKLFIGQLPSELNENDLYAVFHQFGRISQLKIHRDKLTGISQRCGFVEFDKAPSAQAARLALHNLKRLPGMQKPLQVKFADFYVNYKQRKLFIGMISKSLTDVQLIEMFASFGDIEECAVVRETDGRSKGCAFLTYTSKQSAAEAIRALHQSQVMEGCNSPMVVKLADSKSTKLQKRLVSSLIEAKKTDYRTVVLPGTLFTTEARPIYWTSATNCNNSDVTVSYGRSTAYDMTSLPNNCLIMGNRNFPNANLLSTFPLLPMGFATV